MTKDEMKNRISMALKDSTLQHGFEIICKDLETERQLNAEIKARFVKCNTCTDEMKSKCLMFSENLCEGERCEELVDLMGLISKSELEKENAELKEELNEWKNEWHDLRKNPNDLPNNKRSVWCYYGDGYGKGFYDKDDGGWWIEGHIYCSIIDAWCELPIFNME